MPWQRFSPPLSSSLIECEQLYINKPKYSSCKWNLVKMRLKCLLNPRYCSNNSFLVPHKSASSFKDETSGKSRWLVVKNRHSSWKCALIIFRNCRLMDFKWWHQIFSVEFLTCEPVKALSRWTSIRVFYLKENDRSSGRFPKRAVVCFKIHGSWTNLQQTFPSSLYINLSTKLCHNEREKNFQDFSKRRKSQKDASSSVTSAERSEEET